jgi:hypothetical protein
MQENIFLLKKLAKNKMKSGDMAPDDMAPLFIQHARVRTSPQEKSCKKGPYAEIFNISQRGPPPTFFNTHEHARARKKKSCKKRGPTLRSLTDLNVGLPPNIFQHARTRTSPQEKKL